MKKIYLIICSLLSIFVLVGCGEIVTENPDVPTYEFPTTTPAPITPDVPTVDNPTEDNTTPTGDTSTVPTVPSSVKSVVRLTYLEETFIPDNEVKVIWYNDNAQYSSEVNEEGYAVLEGVEDEFNVRLENLDDGYTYNPNIYEIDPDSPNTTIEILRILKPSGRGYNITSNIRYKISNLGAYRTELTKGYPTKYYQFAPSEPGTYRIESYVDTYDDTVNPKLELYMYSTLTKEKDVTTGGSQVAGKYTKNFLHEWNVAEDNFSTSGGGSVVYIFAITAEDKTGETSINVDFEISLVDDYFRDENIPKIMEAEFALDENGDWDSEKWSTVCPTESKSDGYTYINADGGTGTYYNSLMTNGSGLLDGNKFKFNEETGFWCVYDPETDTFGPTLCVQINTPIPFFEKAFVNIEAEGNKALTLSSGTENYKKFIEQTYSSITNSDGVCYVTMELKTFLQKYAKGHALFIDGEGYVEQYGVYALDADQWLFACGYYVK